MTNQVRIAINQEESHQFIQAAEACNKIKANSCSIALSDYIHPKHPNIQWVDVSFSDYQVFFDLAKTFGIILEKVNTQSL